MISLQYIEKLSEKHDIDMVEINREMYRPHVKLFGLIHSRKNEKVWCVYCCTKCKVKFKDAWKLCAIHKELVK